MTVDTRLIFVVRALHEIVESNERMESEELAGMHRVLEDVVVDGLQRRREGSTS